MRACWRGESSTPIRDSTPVVFDGSTIRAPPTGPAFRWTRAAWLVGLRNGSCDADGRGPGGRLLPRRNNLLRHLHKLIEQLHRRLPLQTIRPDPGLIPPQIMMPRSRQITVIPMVQRNHKRRLQCRPLPELQPDLTEDLARHRP